MTPENFHADGMEGAKPRHALDDLPDHLANAVFHLARGLVGESHGENLAWLRAAKVEDVRNTRRQDACLASSSTRQHQHRAIQRLHGLALLAIEIAEIGCSPRTERARGDAARNGLWAQRSRVVTLRLGHFVR